METMYNSYTDLTNSKRRGIITLYTLKPVTKHLRHTKAATFAISADFLKYNTAPTPVS